MAVSGGVRLRHAEGGYRCEQNSSEDVRKKAVAESAPPRITVIAMVPPPRV